MILFNKVLTENANILKLEGELLIVEVNDLKIILQEILGDDGNNITFDMTEIKAVDVPALQLIHSACKTAESMGKVVTVQKGNSEVLKSIIEDSGLLLKAV